MNDYLDGLQTEATSQSFSLDSQGARRVLAQALQFESRGYARHLLAAAYLAGAKSFHCTTRSRAAVAWEWLTMAHRTPSFVGWFPGLGPPHRELEHLQEALLHPKQRLLFRLAAAIQQMSWLGYREIRLESWTGSDCYRWTKTPHKISIKRLKRATYPGVRIFLWENHTDQFPLALHKMRRGKEERAFLEQAARWSPLEVEIDGKPCCRPGLPATRLYPAQLTDHPDLPEFWLQPNTGFARVWPVFEGVTLPPVETGVLDLPGLEVVLREEVSFTLDGTQAQLVKTEALDNRVREVAQAIVGALCQPEHASHPALRHYLFRHREGLQLEHFPLLQRHHLPAISAADLREALLQGHREILGDLVQEDLLLGQELVPSRWFFTRGHGQPLEVKLAPGGQFVAILWPDFNLVGAVARPELWQRTSADWFLEWHSQEPWLLTREKGQPAFWDVSGIRPKREFPTHSLVRFSLCGRRCFAFQDGFAASWLLPHWEAQPDQETDGRAPLGVIGDLQLWSDRVTWSDGRVHRFDEPWKVSTILRPRCSPDHNFVALDSLLGGLELLVLETMRRIPLSLESGLETRFSVDSKYLFVHLEGAWRAFDLQAENFLEQSMAGTAIFGDGRVVHPCGQEVSPPMVPGCEAVEEGVAFLRHKEGRGQVMLHDGRRGQPLWQFQETRFHLVRGYFRWNGDNGVHEVGPEGYVWRPELRLLGTMLVVPDSDGWTYLNPQTLTPTLHLQAKLDEVVTRPLPNHWEWHLISEGRLLVLSPDGTDAVWEKQRIPGLANSKMLQAERDSRLFRRPPDESWYELKGVEEVVACPVTDRILTVSNERAYLGRIGSSKRATLPQGDRPSFSPSGGLFSLSEERGPRTTIYKTDSCRPLGHLPAYGQPQWLRENLLHLNGVLWKAHPKTGWLHPQLLHHDFPLPEAVLDEFAVTRHNGQLSFYDLKRMQLLGTLHPMDDDWVFFTPQGEFEATPGALAHTWTEPQRTPANPEEMTAGLLSRVLAPLVGLPWPTAVVTSGHL